LLFWWRQTGPTSALRYVGLFFALVCLAMGGLLQALQHYWHFALPDARVWYIVVLQGVLAALCVIARRRPAVSDGGLFILLAASLLVMAGFLYASGGHTNPLISLLLLPLAVSAALLHASATLILSVVALFAYSWLTRDFLPLGTDDAQGHRQVMRMHLLGMWVTFAMSVLVILAMIVPMAASLRRQREFISRQRETMLRDERLVALATFAASAAHQLGTPLATLTLLAEEIREQCQDQPDLAEDIGQMHRQIALCKDTLHGMMRRADSIRLGLATLQPVGLFLQGLREQFTLLRPDRSADLRCEVSENETILADDTLEQALLNLLDNAAKACQAAPTITACLQVDELLIRITDHGPGLPEHIEARFGEPFISSETGMGLGLFLSNATIQRLGGRLIIRTDSQGNHAEVHLPRQEQKS
jgi:two-component system sensor histidine kinase RegB